MLEIAPARPLAERVRTAANNRWEVLVLAYQERAREVPGHSSWNADCAKKLGDPKLRLSKGGPSVDHVHAALSRPVIAGHHRERRV
jgi:hypothetical protein